MLPKQDFTTSQKACLFIVVAKDLEFCFGTEISLYFASWAGEFDWINNKWRARLTSLSSSVKRTYNNFLVPWVGSHPSHYPKPPFTSKSSFNLTRSFVKENLVFLLRLMFLQQIVGGCHCLAAFFLKETRLSTPGTLCCWNAGHCMKSKGFNSHFNVNCNLI